MAHPGYGQHRPTGNNVALSSGNVGSSTSSAPTDALQVGREMALSAITAIEQGTVLPKVAG